MAIGCLRSSNLLHYTLVFGILRSPIGFFDTTPSGRLLNRFGKDVDVIDNVLPHNIKAWLFCLVSVRETFMDLTQQSTSLALYFRIASLKASKQAYEMQFFCEPFWCII